MRSLLRPPRGLVHVARGFLMGGADIIPGVSGGTVALILGIYERLVAAVSHFDLTLLAHLRRREWLAAARHVDAGFLASLGCGIGMGIAGLASLMHYLLEHQLQHTYAGFFGLILASSWLVARMVVRWSHAVVGLLAAGAAAAYYIVGLPLLAAPPEGEWYVFVCGGISICAMILPGISGSFILLILGKYADVTGALREMLRGEIAPESLAMLGAFAVGGAVGLLAFSKFLRWLLAYYGPPTMAVLCGFMVGSLRKIWPFKIDLTPTILDSKLKRYENTWPDLWDGGTWLSLGIAVGAFLFVFVLDRLSSPRRPTPEGRQTPEE